MTIPFYLVQTCQRLLLNPKIYSLSESLNTNPVTDTTKQTLQWLINGNQLIDKYAEQWMARLFAKFTILKAIACLVVALFLQDGFL